jgi:hypothetical protein
MSRVSWLWLVFFWVAAACERPDERAAHDRQFAGRVLLGALAYPPSVVVAVSTGEDAAEVTLSTSAAPAQVLTWYRDALRLNGWVLKNEARSPDGTVTLYAQQGERPLWIRLRGSAGASGTTYSLIGAEVRGDTIR